MKYFLNIFIIIYFTIFSSSIVLADDEGYKLAVIDIKFILDNSIAVKDIRKHIEFLSNQLQDEIKNKDIQFKKVEDNINSRQNDISDEELKKLIHEFNSEISIVQHDIKQKKKRLEQIHSDAMLMVNDTVNIIIKDLAVKYNLDIVIPSSYVLFIKSELDITNEALDILNNKIKKVPIKY